MRVHVERYELTVDSGEMWALAISLLRNLKGQVDHCARHNGMETLASNNKQEIQMFRTLASHMGRLGWYEDEMRDLERMINERRHEVDQERKKAAKEREEA